MTRRRGFAPFRRILLARKPHAKTHSMHLCNPHQLQLHTFHLMYLFNLCQVSQDKNFSKPFPQDGAFAGAPNPREQREEAELERDLGLALQNLT